MTPRRPLDITSSPVQVGGSGAAWTTQPRSRSRLLSADSRLDRTAVALGIRLAATHARPVDRSRTPAAPRPWPLRESDPRQTGWVATALAEPAVTTAVRSAQTAWAAAGRLVHADLHSQSVLVRHTALGTRVTLLDRGSVGIGDPAWDVVSALELLGDLDLRDREQAVAQQLFLSAYAAAGGPAAEPSPAWGCIRGLVTAEAYATRGQSRRASDRLERARTAAATLVAPA